MVQQQQKQVLDEARAAGILHLASHYGFYMFPCTGVEKLVKKAEKEGDKDETESAKKPVRFGYQKESTKDEATLTKWIQQGFHAFGIDCAKSQLTVVDVDTCPKKGKVGAQSLVSLLEELELPSLPPTLSVTTASGGKHHIYRDDKRRGQSPIAKDIDIRSSGYIISPYSLILELDQPRSYKEYRIDVCPLMEEPKPLVELPEVLETKIKEQAEKKPDAGEVVLPDTMDSERNIASAINVIRTFGSHKNDPLDVDGDNELYMLCTRIGDYNISRDKCVELLIDHFVTREDVDDRGSETLDWCEKKAINAYAHRLEAVGCRTPEYKSLQAVSAFDSLHIQPVKAEENILVTKTSSKRGCEFLTDIDYLEVSVTKTGGLKIDIHQVDLMDYLRSHGFTKCVLKGFSTENRSYLVRVKSGGATGAVISEVSADDVRDFVLTALRKAPNVLGTKKVIKTVDVKNDKGENIDTTQSETTEDILKEDVENFVLRNLNTDVMLSDKKIHFMHPWSIKVHQDTISESFFYFRDRAVQVTKSGPAYVDYKDLGGAVWATEVIDRDAPVLTEGKGGSFEKFCSLVSGGNKHTIHALNCSLGYLMHRFKQEGLTDYCVIYSDQDSTDEQANGRSGKGLLTKAVTKMRNSYEIDGKDKTFGKSQSFKLQRYQLGQTVAVVDDLYRGFDFENMFTKVANGVEVRRLYEGEFMIPYEKAPKWVISTNYTMNSGTGASSEDRRRDIELVNYFNGSSRTPQKEFGFFFWGVNYPDAEWEFFHNYMFRCVREFLSVPGQKVPKVKFESLETKNFEGATNYYFAQWCLYNGTEPFELGREMSLSEVVEQYKTYINLNAGDDLNDEMKGLRTKMWKWVGEFARFKGWMLVQKNDGSSRKRVLVEKEQIEEGEVK